jgi:hypothetical protein
MTEASSEREIATTRVFDTAAEGEKIKRFAAEANEQNMDRVAALLAKAADGIPSRNDRRPT